jgi:hypothetical protein
MYRKYVPVGMVARSVTGEATFPLQLSQAVPPTFAPADARLVHITKQTRTVETPNSFFIFPYLPFAISTKTPTRNCALMQYQEPKHAVIL